MNERIRQLAEQAGSTHKQNLGVYQFYADELEKFAQLIVRECLGIVHDAERGGSNEIWDNAVKFIRRDLQEHFGVE
jgi:hypothetical protein